MTTVPARWLAALLIVLSCVFGIAVLDPPEVLAARPGLAPSDGAPVRQATPDLTVTKTNNVSGLTTAGSTWTWVFAIRNSGTAPATFTVGQTVLLDNLPTPNVSYPSVSVTPTPVNTPTGNISCVVDGTSNLGCVAAVGPVTIPPGGGFDVTMQATTLFPAIYVDPRAGGLCRVDPSFLIAESAETNNDCGDTVTVVGPDLTVTKTNNVNGTTPMGVPWTWTLTIRNEGVTPATFDAGQRFLLDNLPNAIVSPGPVAVSAIGSPLLNASCAIDGAFNLACVATGVGTNIPAGDGIVLSFQAVTAVPGPYANPRAGGTCAVDPDALVPENSETNNACANTVTVPGPDLTATKSNSVGGAGGVGVPFLWHVLIANTSGTAAGVFANGQRVLVDNLPNANIAYGAPTVTSGAGALGTVSCTIDGGANLVCVAVGAVTMPVGATFDVAFTATPAAVGSYANPRTGGVCLTDPDDVVTELNNANNACVDTVGASLADLRVTKTNSAGGAPALGTPFTWVLTVSNAGGGLASFAAGQTILVDALPAPGLTYSVPSVSSASSVTGGASIVCAIVNSTLTCTATGAVTIGPGGTIQVSIVTRPDQPGSFVNPRAGGTCLVDPNNTVAEGVETNNSCSDAVIVAAAPPPPPPPPPAVAPASAPPPSAHNDDEDEDDRPLTETQRHQRSRTNASGQDDYRTEGNVLEVRCDTSTEPQYEVSFPTHTPYLVIATRDGNQQLRLLYGTRKECPSVKVGDYAEADGEKQHELLFDAHNLTTSR